ncbi:MAG: STAS domain-containing protein [Candidatus Coatesbacteria bacterium]|nr:STAS domain-containing protein [Candidatus Coatesbacteria bacterium]
MELSVREVGGVAVVKVPGHSLEASNVDEFKQDMIPVLDKYSSVVLDVQGLEFVDSSGLGAFLSCLRHLNSSGGDMKITGMQKPVRALFELVRMHRICDVFDNVDEAIRAFKK